MGMTAAAREARRAYMREYRKENRERINARQREWRAKNHGKVKEYQMKYWEKKSASGNIRLPWSAYGITPERKKELIEIAKQEEYASLVLAAALKADRKAAGHIVLSVTKGLPYEYIEYHDRLGRCCVGKTNFYGLRRYFFHLLDVALRERVGGGLDG